jgi:hypothetical protein
MFHIRCIIPSLQRPLIAHITARNIYILCKRFLLSFFFMFIKIKISVCDSSPSINFAHFLYLCLSTFRPIPSLCMTSTSTLFFLLLLLPSFHFMEFLLIFLHNSYVIIHFSAWNFSYLPSKF